MPDQDFERAFSTLAYSELEQKAPGLFPYLIGFQLVDKNEEETHAVGIFGFKVNDQWYYSPVFWMNGQLKGYDLLYIVSQDLFVPLSEAWINFLMSRQPYIIGSKEEKTVDQMGAMSPDFTIFRRSPIFNAYKTSSAKLLPVPKDIMERMFQKISKSMGLTDTLKTLPAGYTKQVIQAMEKNSAFKEAMFKFYSPEELQDVVQLLIGHELFKTAEPQHFISNEKNAPVEIVYDRPTAQDGVDSFTPLTTEEKERMMAGSPVIRDPRKGESETSNLYYMKKFQETFQTPSMAGFWNVLMQDGSAKPVFVSNSVKIIGAGKKPAYDLVVDPETKNWVHIEPRGVFAKGMLDDSYFQKFYKGLVDVEDAAVGDVGMIVSDNMESTVPFRVLEKMTDDKDVVTLKVEPDDCVQSVTASSGMNTPSVERWPYNTGDDGRSVTQISYAFDKYDCGHRIQLVNGPARPTNIRETLMIGKQRAKFFKLGEAKEPRPSAQARPMLDPWYTFKKDHKLSLGSEAHIDMIVKTCGLKKMAVETVGDFMNIDFRDQHYRHVPVKQAAAKIIEICGCNEEQATVLVDRVRQEKKADVFVKLAYGGPTFNTPSPAYDDMYRAPVTSPYEVTDVLPSQLASREPAPIDSATHYFAGQAAQKGQKDVFDASVMLGLARSGRLDDRVHDFIKDIIVGNDRIGRILFLYYWHFDEFSDKYGKEDMIELEDLLKEVFKQTGDLILFLKKTSVEPDAVATDSVVKL